MDKIELLIFDLDGTLIDSRHDLVSSINSMLQEFNAELLSMQTVIQFIGRGVRNLVTQSLNAAHALDIDPDYALHTFESIYARHLLDTTILYPTVFETLETLTHLDKVILSNKSHAFIQQILDGLKITKHFSLIIGGDTLPVMKPSRESIDYILRHENVDACQSIIIGDSATDIDAGKAAGIKTCGVLYGLTPQDEMMKLGTDFTIKIFSDLLNIV